jgi:hypothetical protein
MPRAASKSNAGVAEVRRRFPLMPIRVRVGARAGMFAPVQTWESIMTPSSSRSYLVVAVAAISTSAMFFAPANASTGAASSPPQPTSTRQVSDAPNPNRQVCRETRITGSRFARRLCRSEGDRAAAEKESQDGVRDFQNQGYERPPEPALIGPAPK